jgi:hypothetical protein
MHNDWGGIGIASRTRPHSLRHVHPNTSPHPSEHGRRDAHRLGRHEHSLIPERSNACDLLSAAERLLRERVNDLRVCARLDAYRLCLCLRCEPRRVCLCLRLETRALCDGLRCCDGRVRLCVCFGLIIEKFVK